MSIFFGLHVGLTGCLGFARQPGFFFDVIQAVVEYYTVASPPFKGETGEGVVELHVI